VTHVKFHKVAFALLIIGGLNWGLEALGTGLGHWGLPMWLLQVVYGLVGLAALSELVAHKKLCRNCMGMMQDKGMGKM
jgi:uncharacterized membrane protein YuzA (DUF378 family)